MENKSLEQIRERDKDKVVKRDDINFKMIAEILLSINLFIFFASYSMFQEIYLTKSLVIMDNSILQILSIINFIFLFYDYRKFDFDDIVNKRISIIVGTTALLFIYLILSVLFSYLPLLHTNIITLIPE